MHLARFIFINMMVMIIIITVSTWILIFDAYVCMIWFVIDINRIRDRIELSCGRWESICDSNDLDARSFTMMQMLQKKDPLMLLSEAKMVRTQIYIDIFTNVDKNVPKWIRYYSSILEKPLSRAHSSPFSHFRRKNYFSLFYSFEIRCEYMFFGYVRAIFILQIHICIDVHCRES